MAFDYVQGEYSDSWLDKLFGPHSDQEPEGQASFSGSWADLDTTLNPASGGEDSVSQGNLPQVLDPVRSPFPNLLPIMTQILPVGTSFVA